MEKRIKCLRCGRPMELLRREHLQMGKTGWILGGLDNLLSGGLDVDILACPGCGRSYEMDSPQCPFCREKNTKLF